MIHTLEELEEIAEAKREKDSETKEELRVCIGSSCLSLGADQIEKDLKEEISCRGLKDKCKVKGVGCNGLCSAGVLVSHIDREKNSETMYGNLGTSDIKSVAEAYESGTILKEKLLDPHDPFFLNQEKIVLENAGYIDPNDIEDYIAHDGYFALFNAIIELSAEEVIAEVKKSGLRGRGGGGYPVGLKWETVAKVDSEQKYIVCNGDEGDPGAFMDRAIMEADPHRVIEGMALAGFACGANKGYVYVRAEYPIAVEKLNKAIKQAKRLGILGQNIAGSNFSFDLEVRLGGGAFVCGEATALVTSIEGNRGNPRQKPPHLSDYGLWGEPTILNNVESFANIAPIIRKGGAWYAGFGTEKSPGTKVFALSGHVKNTGLVEVPMGMSLRDIIYKVGGGVPEGKKLKVVQTGGPSGGCIPEHLLDIPVDYDSLKSVGSMMGSGGMIVTDDSQSIVEVARFFVEFCASESCGKCVPCRVGTTELTNILDKFVAKTATKEDLILLQDLCTVVKETSLCGLGQAAPNPVITTLKYFEDEYLEAIKND